MLLKFQTYKQMEVVKSDEMIERFLTQTADGIRRIAQMSVAVDETAIIIIIRKRVIIKNIKKTCKQTQV